jgi:hypothetical protein
MKLPYERYNGNGEADKSNRQQIFEGLRSRIDMCGWEPMLLSCADAIDAVVCALMAVAVTSDCMTAPPDKNIAHLEGWIATSK